MRNPGEGLPANSSWPQRLGQAFGGPRQNESLPAQPTMNGIEAEFAAIETIQRPGSCALPKP